MNLQSILPEGTVAIWNQGPGILIDGPVTIGPNECFGNLTAEDTVFSDNAFFTGSEGTLYAYYKPKGGSLEDIKVKLIEYPEVSRTYLQVHETDALVYRVAALPISRLSVDYVIQMDKPFEGTPEIVSLEHDLLAEKPQTLEEFLLQRWRDRLEFVSKNKFHDIAKVELIECSLLVPLTPE